jgi:transposase-like protein
MIYLHTYEYVLLNNKQQATYKRVFEKLMEIEPALRPESIVSDFEISAINAINEVFPNAQITGCMFHLAQNLWKKIQKIHLVECYRENEDTRKKCKMLLALSYVAVKDVLLGTRKTGQMCDSVVKISKPYLSYS